MLSKDDREAIEFAINLLQEALTANNDEHIEECIDKAVKVIIGVDDI